MSETAAVTDLKGGVTTSVTAADVARFWGKVAKTPTCWLWTRGGTAKGYGQFSVGRRRFYAHRFAYALLVGPVPTGLTIDHLCEVKRCVNPQHMEPVTSGENTRRYYWRKRAAA